MSYPSSLRRKEKPTEEISEESYKFPSSLRLKQPEESLAGNILRQTGRTGARAIETVLGAPRAIGEFGEMLVPEKKLKKLAGKVGLEEPVGQALELTKKYAPYKLFPKSEDIRENVTKHLFGEKLEPKNEWERKADEVVSDFAALALPLPGSQLRILKPALLAAGGNIASEVVGHIGGTEKQKTYAKLGTILTGSLINPKAAENLKNDLYKKAREVRPDDAKISSKNLLNKVDSFEKQLMKGDPDISSKKKSLDLIKKIKDKSSSGDITVENLEEFKRNINESRSALYQEFALDKVGRKAAKRNLDMVSKFVDNALNEYGKQNPEWEAFYRPANEVHGAIVQSHKVRNIITRNAKKWGFTTLMAELGLHHAAGLPAVGISIAGGAAALGAGEITSRIVKSPTLRKHYMNLVNAAMKEDLVALHENMKKLNTEINK